MRRANRIYILLGVLALLCIATFCAVKAEESREQISNSGETILEVSADSVSALSWEKGSESYSFHKDDVWEYDEDEAFPVDEEKINDLLDPFEEMGASFIIEEPEDLSQYGLDSPECTIRIETEEKSYEILLGDYSNMDSERYVSIGDGNVYLVKEDPLEAYDVSLSDLIDHDETPYFGQVSSVQFTGSENYTIIYEEDSDETYREDDVYFVRQSGETTALDTYAVEDYLETVTYLDLSDYVTYDADDEELEKYGLDDPELSISVDYTYEDEDGEEVTKNFILHLSRDPKERKKAEKKAEKKGKDDGEDEEDDEKITAYARVGDSKIIYKITSSGYKELMDASVDTFRHKEAVPAEFEDVKQIDISLEGKDYSITSKGKKNKRTWYYKKEKLEIDDLEDAVSDLKADSFTGEKPSKKEEIRLTVHLDKKNDPKVEICLYRYDGSFCLATVDGESFGLVERSRVIDLVEAVQAVVLNE
ncbi:MAG: DUF4340 domain-containing protein [Emergencia sp.]